MTQTILRSTEDRSINIVEPSEDGGAIESRFVQRDDDTIILYLSSATGCDKACRFCWLTQTGQTMMEHVPVDGYLNQAVHLLELLKKEDKIKGATKLHLNFMSRGDVCANPHFVNQTWSVINGLTYIASHYRLEPFFKISTIFPKTELFGEDNVWLGSWVRHLLNLNQNIEVYYSLYSLRPEFRKRWIPKAIDPDLVGRAFAKTKNRMRLHHALIADQNDSDEDLSLIYKWLVKHDIVCKFNLVRYNSFDVSCGEESSQARIEHYTGMIRLANNITDVQIVNRVGGDVYASCGMFVS